MEHEEIQTSAQRKGKCRAIPDEVSERTPLLPSSHQVISEQVSSRRSGRRRLYVLLSTVFLSTLCICILILLVLGLLAYSYRSKIEDIVPEDVLQEAVVISGPTRVDVLNATEGMVWVQIEGAVGIDATSALKTALYGDVKAEEGWQSYFGKWFLRKLGSVTANATAVRVISSSSNKQVVLASVSTPQITLPLTIDPPRGLSWLTPLSLPVCFAVTNNMTDLEIFIKESWRTGLVDVQLNSSQVSIHGGTSDESSWRRRLNIIENNIVVHFQHKIPNLPGLPQPGKGSPFPEFSDLVKLESFNVTTENKNITVAARASFINPLPPPYVMRIPEVPFIVYLANPNSTIEGASIEPDTSHLPRTVAVAVGRTSAFDLTYKHPNTTVSMKAGPAAISRDATPLISSLVSLYIAGRDAPVILGTPLLPSLRIPAELPGPSPRPQILKDVTIRDMRITLHGERVLASGVVYARVVLPPGIRLSLEAESIWPDVLVFDGEVPDNAEDMISLPWHDRWPIHIHPRLPRWGSEKEPPKGEPGDHDKHGKIPKEPLPEPLPERAFARIRPDDWLDAQSTPLDADEGKGASQFAVTARVQDVPLEVLPGREMVLQRFVAKVMFGTSGALAGVRGVAAVAARVDGIALGEDDDSNDSHVVELTGLPFSGSFRVGKKGF